MLGAVFVQIFAVLGIGFCCSPKQDLSSAPSAKHRLVIVSFDGFRYDYVHKYRTPNLAKMAANGVWAKDGYIPTFVSKTFPTHWTIVTGLYAESHGLIDNDFFDYSSNLTFTKTTLDKRWFRGEPIWATVRRINKTSGVLFWPGVMVENPLIRPNYARPYDDGMDFDKRVDILLSWLDLGVDLTMVYFTEPDKSGHKYGPDSKQVRSQVERLDRLVGKIRRKVLNEHPDVSIIVLSDHGMAKIKETIFLRERLDFYFVSSITQMGTIVGIIPQPGYFNAVLYHLQVNSHPNVSFFKKQDLPERYHYKKSERLAPIVLLADEGYLLSPLPFKDHTKGNHGYDNALLSMRGIFFAEGKAFKKNLIVKPFHAVNLYPLFCLILGVTPAPNNGSLENLVHIVDTLSVAI